MQVKTAQTPPELQPAESPRSKGKKPAEQDAASASGFEAAIAQASVAPAFSAEATQLARATNAGVQQQAQSGAEKAAASGSSQGQGQGRQPAQSGIEKIFDDYSKKQELTRDTRSPMLQSGPKPWSADWVFQGGEHMNPQMKPLFESAPKRAEQGGASSERARAAEAATAAQAMTGLSVGSSLSALAAELQAIQGEIDSIDAGQSPGGTEKAKSADKAQAALFGNSGVSGSDFLETLNAIRAPDASLRVINGGREGAAEKSGQAMRERPQGSFAAELTAGLSGASAINGAGAAGAPVVTGHVVQGAMAKDRLSHESLQGMTSQIRTLNAQGGGEMRIRLRPDNLGELKVRVTSNGNDVGIQFEASSESAKKVIEETMSHLRESLAGHQLNLSKVHVALADAQAGSFSSNSGNSGSQSAWGDAGTALNHNGAQSFDRGSGDAQGWNERSGGSSGDRDSLPGMNRRAFGAAAGVARAQARGASGRLDVMA